MGRQAKISMTGCNTQNVEWKSSGTVQDIGGGVHEVVHEQGDLLDAQFRSRSLRSKY